MTENAPSGTGTVAAARIDRAIRFEQSDPYDDTEVTIVGTATPRLSWRIADAPAGWVQQRAEVRLTLPDGENFHASLDGDAQLLIDWPFAALASRGRAELAVRCEGAHGWTPWSEPAAVEVSLLTPDDWSATWITPVAGAAPEDPAPVIGTTFEVDAGDDHGGGAGAGGALVSARLHITALGIIAPTLNGERVSRDHFTPGWTTYDKLVRFRTYDVTALIRAGSNSFETAIGNGWYRGRIASLPIHRAEYYGDRLALLAQLELEYSDGRRVTIGTDETWMTAPSRILANDFYDGQATDLRLRDRPALDRPVERLHAAIGRLSVAVAPPVRQLDVVTPVSLVARDGATIVDFGRNLVGWVRLRVSGAPTSTEVTVRHAEVLEGGGGGGDGGGLGGGGGLAMRPLRSAQATDRYLLAGRGTELLEPQFTYHGFRYAEIAGVPADATIEVEAVVLGSALRRTGWLETSDEQLNQLHRNVVTSMQGNFLDIPTDCPQRDERLGWTGDTQVFAPTASVLYDVSSFLDGWLESLALDQLPDGTVPAVVPRVFPQENALAGWSDAAVIVPWVLYQRYRDVGILARQYDSMVAWVEKVRSLAAPSGLWQGGTQLGDWLDPLAPPNDPAAAQADPDVIASAHFYHSVDLLSMCAGVLGREDDERAYRDLANGIRRSFTEQYLTADGHITSDCQTVYALALAWDIIDDDLTRVRAGERLAQLVESQGFTVATGFLGTPVVLHALTLAGRTDDAYRMLTSHDFPSWLYAVDLGATTIWERWDSLLADGTVNPGDMTSFNHYAFGAVTNWMHRTIGGVTSLTPGCRTIRVRPIPGAGLTSGGLTYDSPYGRIVTEWTLDGERFHLRLVVPVGVTATVELPDGTRLTDVEHGEYRYAAEVGESRPAA